MKMVPKQKSEVQFNGEKKFDLGWSIPYSTSVKKEFSERYDNIVKLYQELARDVYWNNLIYSIDIKFKPVIGNIYYLYSENEKHFLSLISPREWKKETCVGEFKFDHNGKWNKM